jgi:uncharacterized protein
MSNVRITILAKAPQPGRAKTRLIPALGEQGAAFLARRMLEFTLEQALAAALGPVELCITPGPLSGAWRGISIPGDVVLVDQGDGDLGRRLSRAAARALSGGGPVLLTGTDCPGLTCERLREAARELGSHDAVIHPAADGGYTLLGLRRFDGSVFADIAWSTASVAASTMERIGRLGWSLHRAQTLQDIDEPADLAHVPEPWLSGCRARAAVERRQ